MTNSQTRSAIVGVSALALALFSGGCNPGAGGASGGVTTAPGSSPSLVSVEVGRLVDIYAYRIIDQNGDTDRRAVDNRVPVRIAQDVVIDPSIDTDDLFDATGSASADANYRFLPFDVEVGHDELVILWDDRGAGTEADRFQTALEQAQTGLVPVPPAFRGQNVLTQPIPVVPRNGAFKLTFSAGLGLDSSDFRVNPALIQVLLFEDDPDVVGPLQAFRPTSVRTIAKDNVVILDTTVLGAEQAGGLNPSDGLRASSDNVTANYRIAIPTDGVASSLLNVNPDPIPEQNRVDFRGDPAVVRDVRTGNRNDGAIGSLADFERPQIIAKREIGIVSVDQATRQVTVAMRQQNLAVRGRLPFVDGVLQPTNTPGLFRPGGRNAVPLVDSNGLRFPLPSGDFITQTVLSPAGEPVTIRAEVIRNFRVGTVEADPNFAGPGLTAGGTDGGEILDEDLVLQLSTVEAFDSQGNRVTFQTGPGDGMGNGGATAEAQVRYYEFISYASGSNSLSDAGRRAEFITVDPMPSVDLLVGADPMVNVGVQFNEPVDFERLSPSDNYVLTNSFVDASNFQSMIVSPKSSTLNMVVTELVDQSSDGTDVRLRAPEGLFHQAGQSEIYWFHVDIENDAVADFAGNPLQLFDLRSPNLVTVSEIGGVTLSPSIVVDVPLQNFSVPFALDSNANDNLVGWQIKRFADLDEDGTVNGALDFFGQFQVQGGELRGAAPLRRSATADESANGVSHTLGSITRFERGECFIPGDSTDPMNIVPGSFIGPGNSTATYSGVPPTGLLYQTPSMVATVLTPPQIFTPPNGPQIFGGIGEPHTPYGARLQMTYREDDFGLSYTNPNDLNIDVEQMHWATWNESTVLFDVFDRYTLQLGHAGKRPDIKFEIVDQGFVDPMTMMFVPDMDGVTCELNCQSLFSSLSTRFADNPLPTSGMTTVVENQRYVINPSNAFRSASGFTYVPYPEFETTYTWRDSRLVSVDSNGNVVGLGGAVDPNGVPFGDATANVSSPWIQDSPILDIANAAMPAVAYPITGNFPTGVYVEDAGDFRGSIARDHDPIALPLLMDFQVFPDNTVQIGTGANIFHIGYIGPSFADPPPTANGYYNLGARVNTALPFNCNNINWPLFRVYSFGGPDLNNPGNFTTVIPDLEEVASGGVVIDRGLGAIFDPVNGRAQVEAGDSHIHWAQVDLVRRVSLVTFGFFDTETPNQHALPGTFEGPLPPQTGFPNLTGLGSGVTSIVAILDPPILDQPGGTDVTVEFRGADMIPNAGLWDPGTDNNFDTRNNLANPNFACEAYRYSKGDIAADPNPTPTNDPGFAMMPPMAAFNGPQQRPVADGLTPYVVDRDLDTIRAPVTNLLPRYFNLRLVLENNINATPATAPSLRSLGIVYRKQQ